MDWSCAQDRLWESKILNEAQIMFVLVTKAHMHVIVAGVDSAYLTRTGERSTI